MEMPTNTLLLARHTRRSFFVTLVFCMSVLIVSMLGQSRLMEETIKEAETVTGLIEFWNSKSSLEEILLISEILLNDEAKQLQLNDAIRVRYENNQARDRLFYSTCTSLIDVSVYPSNSENSELTSIALNNSSAGVDIFEVIKPGEENEVWNILQTNPRNLSEFRILWDFLYNQDIMVSVDRLEYNLITLDDKILWHETDNIVLGEAYPNTFSSGNELEKFFPDEKFIFDFVDPSFQEPVHIKNDGILYYGEFDDSLNNIFPAERLEIYNGTIVEINEIILNQYKQKMPESYFNSLRTGNANSIILFNCFTDVQTRAELGPQTILDSLERSRIQGFNRLILHVPAHVDRHPFVWSKAWIRNAMKAGFIDEVSGSIKGQFEQAFPNLSSALVGFDSIRIEDLSNLINRLQSELGQAVSVMGISLPASEIQNYGVLIILALQLYTLIHFYEFCSRLNQNRKKEIINEEVLKVLEEPWIFFYLSIGALLTSIVFIFFPFVSILLIFELFPDQDSYGAFETLLGKKLDGAFRMVSSLGSLSIVILEISMLLNARKFWNLVDARHAQ
ncbi:MAG: hypothetical protein AAGF58_00015 [Pseudomonadota bacterium]